MAREKRAATNTVSKQAMPKSTKRVKPRRKTSLSSLRGLNPVVGAGVAVRGARKAASNIATGAKAAGKAVKRGFKGVAAANRRGKKQGRAAIQAFEAAKRSRRRNRK